MMMSSTTEWEAIRRMACDFVVCVEFIQAIGLIRSERPLLRQMQDLESLIND
jgi:hypothetical protein